MTRFASLLAAALFAYACLPAPTFAGTPVVLAGPNNAVTGIAGCAEVGTVFTDGTAVQYVCAAVGDVGTARWVSASSNSPVAYPLGVALVPIDCAGRTITNAGAIRLQTYTLPVNPSPGLMCRFSAQSSHRMILDPQGSSGCALGPACDQIVSHTLGSGNSMGSPSHTSFGDAVECVAADADTWLCRNIQGFWEDNG